jgi:type II secretion system protein J
MTAPRRHHRRRRNAAGFSLLELVLVMSVSAMLALSLYTAMHIALQARKSARAAVEPTRVGAIATDLLRQDFENVQPPTGILAGPFIGTPGGSGQSTSAGDDVQFYTIGRDEPADDSPLDEGIRKVELLVDTSQNPPALIRRETRNLLASAEPQVNDEILIRGVRTFTVRYFDGYSWQDTWDSTQNNNILPLAVAVTLEMNDPTAADPAQAPPRTLTRVYPLSCGKSIDDTSALEGLQ